MTLRFLSRWGKASRAAPVAYVWHEKILATATTERNSLGSIVSKSKLNADQRGFLSSRPAGRPSSWQDRLPRRRS